MSAETEESLQVVLEAGVRDAELTVRVTPGHREELLEVLHGHGLQASRVAEFSASTTLEVLSTTTLGVPGAVFLGVRAVPKAAWDAVAQAVTDWSTRQTAARVEYEFGDGRKLTVENDRRAARRALDEVILPDVREQQIARHDQWDQMRGQTIDGDEDTDEDTDGR